MKLNSPAAAVKRLFGGLPVLNGLVALEVEHRVVSLLGLALFPGKLFLADLVPSANAGVEG